MTTAKTTSAQKSTGVVGTIEKDAEAIVHGVEYVGSGINVVIHGVEKRLPKFVASLVSKVKGLLGPNQPHFIALLASLYTVATHDLTKWESVIALGSSLIGSTVVKKVSAKVPAK